MQELTIEEQKTTNGTEPEIEWIEDESADAMRAALFAPDFEDRSELVVPVPEWRRKVLIQMATGTQRAEYTAWVSAQNTKDPNYMKQINYYLVSHFCLNMRERKPFLKGLGDLSAFMDKRNGAIIDMLAQTVMKFCQLDGSTGEQAKKNLERGRTTGITN